MNIDDKKKAKEHKSYQAVINECLEKAKKGEYIFRGTSRECVHKSKVIESSLFRQLKKSRFSQPSSVPRGIEKAKVERAKKFFPANTTIVEILSELRHYGEKLCVIDFTRNIFVALFFACQKTYDNQERPTKINGELIMIEEPPPKADIDFTSQEPYTINPSINLPSNNRVIAQSSIFVHAPNGFIDTNDLYTENFSIRIEEKHKVKILEYLKKYFDIDSTSIFRDVIGFINNPSNIDSGNLERAIHACDEGEYKVGIKLLTNEIKIRRMRKLDIREHLKTRSLAWFRLGEFGKSINDSSKAIEENGSTLSGFLTRAITKCKSGQNSGALDDINIFIANRTDVESAYLWRALINIKLKRFKDIFIDIENYLRLEPDSAIADCLQELTKLSLSRIGRINIINIGASKNIVKSNKRDININLTLIPKKKYRAILEKLDDKLKNNSKNITTYIDRGRVKLLLNMHKEAINDFTNAIKLLKFTDENTEPCIASAFQYRGLAKMNSSDFEGAKIDFDEALKDRPFDPEILCDRSSSNYAIGESLERKNYLDAATKYFNYALFELDLAVELKPDLIKAFHIRHKVNYALGNYIEAQNDLEEIYRLNKKILLNTILSHRD